MPCYLLNFYDGHRFAEESLWREFADFNEARAQALDVLRAATLDKGGPTATMISMFIEIYDADLTLLGTIRFTDVLRITS